MKTSRLLAASAASAALAFAPSAAFAAPGPDGAGYNGGGVEAIIIENQNPESCTFPVTVEAGDAATVTLTVRDADLEVVYEVQKDNDIQGTVDFTVQLGAGCSGTYSLTTTDETGAVLASGSVTIDDGGANAGGADSGDTTAGGVAQSGSTGSGSAAAGDNVGGLPDTGSSSVLVVGGLAGAGLLASGSLLLVRRRRAAA